jgi:hypothetical protein
MGQQHGLYENGQGDARTTPPEFELSPGDRLFVLRYGQLGPDEVQHHDAIKGNAASLWNTIALLQPSRERALAQTKLEEAIMWAVKALTASREPSAAAMSGYKPGAAE